MWGLFKGWKRKVGTVTLLLACLFVAGWVRSTVKVDLVILGGAESNRVFISGGGAFCLANMASWMIHSTAREENGRMVDDMTIIPLNSYLRYSGLNTHSWNSHRLVVLQTEDFNGPRRQLISYLYIVFPLTLLSAWLLLSQPPLASRIIPSWRRPMSDFFQPLRHKVGVATLLLACALTAGWVRSFYVEDNNFLPNRMGSICNHLAIR